VPADTANYVLKGNTKSKNTALGDFNRANQRNKNTSEGRQWKEPKGTIYSHNYILKNKNMTCETCENYLNI